MADETKQIAEIEYLSKKIEASQVPPELAETIDIMVQRIRRMARQGQESGEYEPIAKFIDWCLRMPWGKVTQDNLDLENAKKIMDSHHYGGEHVKQTILEYLAILKKKSVQVGAQYQAPVLCFIGPQGTGKTTMAKAIAESLGRPFYRISLGALSASSELRGKPKGNPDAEPGQIVKALVNCKALSPVILLDEIDKVSGSESALQDFMAILLEVLDPQQNTSFRDLYIDYPVDLSRVFFICTANTLKTLTRALLDRLEIVEFRDYSPEEKVVIAGRYLWPKVLEYAGLTPQEIQIADEAWPIIIEKLGKDPGVRRLERNLQKLARKATKLIVTGQAQSVIINSQNVESYLQEEVALSELQEKEYRGVENEQEMRKQVKDQAFQATNNIQQQQEPAPSLKAQKQEAPPRVEQAQQSTQTIGGVQEAQQPQVTTPQQ
ncbi:AAA family ATPase [Candidatus Dojkabacteria bacterium]|nr:AAA family ATPase [Candidatus Dojkabacteria bacterium]